MAGVAARRCCGQRGRAVHRHRTATVRERACSYTEILALDLSTPLLYVKGVGPARAAMLEAKGLRVVEDILTYAPFRYEDRTKFYPIAEVDEAMPYVQLKGKFTDFEIIGLKNKKRLIGYFTDGKRLLWEYPRDTGKGEQMDFVEAMELNEEGLIQRHCVYWGWFGVRVLERDEYHH